MKILITGAKGRLGSALVRRLRDTHDVIALVGEGSDGELVDLTRWDDTRAVISRIMPDFVVHTAAWTDVDGCARDPQQAVLVNGLAAGYVAAATGAHHIPLLHISSNEVFDGSATAPYREYDPTHAVNPYGYSKWVGEQAVRRHNPQHMIVRTAWLFAHGGKNFIQSILNAAHAGRPLRVVADEISNPTYNEDLATAIVALLERGCPGVYHLTNDGQTSRYEFARAILDQSGLAATPVERISLREWDRPSSPPPFAPLANEAAAALGVTLRPWQEALRAFLEQEAAHHA